MARNTRHAKVLSRAKAKKASIALLLGLLFFVQLVLGAIPGFGTLAVHAKEAGDGSVQSIDLNGITLQINEDNGDLVGITFPSNANLSGATSLTMDAAYVDFGHQNDFWPDDWGAYMRDTLNFQNMDDENMGASDLPRTIGYKLQDESQEYPRIDPEDVTITTDNATYVAVQYTMPAYNSAPIELDVETVYTVNELGYVSMSSTLTNNLDRDVIVNGAATVVSGVDLQADALFEMPYNIPAYVYEVAGLPEGYSIAGEFSTPLIHFFNGDTDVNFIFANEYEKWVPSVTMGANGKVDVINLSCTLDMLAPGESLYLGEQMIQLCDADEGYAAAQSLYTSRGWVAPTDGAKGATIYSGHPAGVSDNNFEGPGGTLEDFEEKLPAIAGLGFDTMWLLPVFEHPSNSGSVYLPYNLDNIDGRYSSLVQDAGSSLTVEETRELAAQSMQAYGEAVVSEGLRFIIDYVPHGPYAFTSEMNGTPYPENPWFEEGNEDRNSWVSKSWWGEDRLEWDSWYPLDAANQEYIAYMKDLVSWQAGVYNFTGTRIDYDVGSLPTWQPYGDNRNSQTGLYGAANLTKAMRDAYIEKGITPLILPENNNPTPYFMAATDVFHDMAFYKATLESRWGGDDEYEFAATVAHFLKTEILASYEGLQIGRFLGNHDTIAAYWYPGVFDCARPETVYGQAKVRALWVLLSSIDGALIIYENDEIGNEEFFTDLLAMRGQEFGTNNGMDIEYYNDITSGIVAFRRYDENGQKLVLVNLVDNTETRDFSNIDIGGVKFSTADAEIVYGDADIAGDSITVPAYGYVVLDITGGDAFEGPNTAQQYIVRNIAQELEEQDAMYREKAENYESFPVAIPDFEPGEIEPGHLLVFSPVDEYSAETPDGPVWKYMYYAMNDDTVDFCETAQGNADGVWRAYKTGTGDWDFEWAGAGRSNSYYPAHQYFELDTNTGGQVYGLLTFVAPLSATYTIYPFDIIDVGEGATSIVVVLKNGEHADKSPMMDSKTGKTTMPQLEYTLEAGDTLTFYITRMDGAYAYAEMDGMTIAVTGGEGIPIEPTEEDVARMEAEGNGDGNGGNTVLYIVIAAVVVVAAAVVAVVAVKRRKGSK